jgi:hypothetical protein
MDFGEATPSKAPPAALPFICELKKVIIVKLKKIV